MNAHGNELLQVYREMDYRFQNDVSLHYIGPSEPPTDFSSSFTLRFKSPFNALGAATTLLDVIREHFALSPFWEGTQYHVAFQLQFIADYLPVQDARLNSIATLTSLELKDRDDTYKTPAALIYEEIKTGRRNARRKGPSGNDEWIRVDSSFVRAYDKNKPSRRRQDGSQGFSAEEDESVRLYERYLDYRNQDRVRAQRELYLLVVLLDYLLGIPDPSKTGNDDPRRLSLYHVVTHMMSSRHHASTGDIFSQTVRRALFESMLDIRTPVSSVKRYEQLLEAELIRSELTDRTQRNA